MKFSIFLNIVNLLILVWLVLVVNEISSEVSWLQVNEQISISNRGGF